MFAAVMPILNHEVTNEKEGSPNRYRGTSHSNSTVSTSLNLGLAMLHRRPLCTILPTCFLYQNVTSTKETAQVYLQVKYSCTVLGNAFLKPNLESEQFITLSSPIHFVSIAVFFSGSTLFQAFNLLLLSVLGSSQSPGILLLYLSLPPCSLLSLIVSPVQLWSPIFTSTLLISSSG